jgi:hypothetical protein
LDKKAGYIALATTTTSQKGLSQMGIIIGAVLGAVFLCSIIVGFVVSLFCCKRCEPIKDIIMRKNKREAYKADDVSKNRSINKY